MWRAVSGFTSLDVDGSVYGATTVEYTAHIWLLFCVIATGMHMWIIFRAECSIKTRVEELYWR